MDFIHGILIGASIPAIIVIVIWPFRESREIPDWTDEEYINKPRAVTRIHADDLDWEIK